MVLMVLSQINGVNMILLYTPHLFKQSGVATDKAAMLNSIYISLWITFCTVIAFWLTQKFKRRSILMCGTIGMACGHLMMFVNFTLQMPRLFDARRDAGCHRRLHVVACPVVLGGAFRVVSQPGPRQGDVDRHLCDVPFLLRSHKSVPGGARSVHRLVWQSGRHVYLPGHLPDVYALRLCVLPETKDKTLEEIGEFWLEEPGECRYKSAVSMAVY